MNMTKDIPTSPAKRRALFPRVRAVPSGAGRASGWAAGAPDPATAR